MGASGSGARARFLATRRRAALWFAHESFSTPSSTRATTHLRPLRAAREDQPRRLEEALDVEPQVQHEPLKRGGDRGAHGVNRR
jgi:hypothetical protein